MNLATIPHWLSPGWLAFYVFVCVCAWLYGKALARERHERARREAERKWPEVRGTVFSCGRGPKGQNPEMVVDVPNGPQRGRYLVSVSVSLAAGCEIGQPLICRVGRHPGDRISDPLRCVIERML